MLTFRLYISIFIYTVVGMKVYRIEYVYICIVFGLIVRFGNDFILYLCYALQPTSIDQNIGVALHRWSLLYSETTGRVWLDFNMTTKSVTFIWVFEYGKVTWLLTGRWQ